MDEHERWPVITGFMIFIANEDVEVLSAFEAETELRVVITWEVCVKQRNITHICQPVKQKLKDIIAVGGEQQNIA